MNLYIRVHSCSYHPDQDREYFQHWRRLSCVPSQTNNHPSLPKDNHYSDSYHYRLILSLIHMNELRVFFFNLASFIHVCKIHSCCYMQHQLILVFVCMYVHTHMYVSRYYQTVFQSNFYHFTLLLTVYESSIVLHQLANLLTLLIVNSFNFSHFMGNISHYYFCFYFPYR